MADKEPGRPQLSLVPEPELDFLTAGFLGAIRTKREYETGVRILDQTWIDSLLGDPDKGPMLEDMLRSRVGAGRHDPTQQEAVEADLQAVMAAITDPTVVLNDERLQDFKDGFLQILDIINPALYAEPDGDHSQPS